MRFGSVCSGIEAASVAWQPLGWEAAWFSEIEQFPSALLAHRYPSVPNLGDMTQLPSLIDMGLIEAPDVLCGGTPCQAFSVAGLRKSLDDKRGNLSLVFCEVANAIDRKRIAAGMAPSIILWENVPGVLSTNDNAFGCVMGSLAGEDEALVPSGGKWTNAGCVYGPQRTVAWRVLDAQYFGLAQRRKRVFVVASARDDFDPAAVLFEFDGLRRDITPIRGAGEGVTACTTSSFGGCREGVGTLRASAGGLGGGSESLIIHTFALAGNTIGRQPENGGNGGGYSQEIGYTLTRTDVQAVAVIKGGQGSRAGGIGCDSQIAPTHSAVRRLTPTECERLQGFPDGYTDVPHRGKPAADGQRYKALGNSWAVSVVQWIGKRIREAVKC